MALTTTIFSVSAMQTSATYRKVADKAVKLYSDPLTNYQRQVRNWENFYSLPKSERQTYAMAVMHYSKVRLGSPATVLSSSDLASDLAVMDGLCEAYAGHLAGDSGTLCEGFTTLTSGVRELIPENDITFVTEWLDEEQLHPVDLGNALEFIGDLRPIDPYWVGQIAESVEAQANEMLSELMYEMQSRGASWGGKALKWVAEQAAEYVLEELWDATESGERDDDEDRLPNKMDTDMDNDGKKDGKYGGPDKDDDGDGVPNDKDNYPRDKTKSIFPESEVWLLQAHMEGLMTFDQIEFVPVVESLAQATDWVGFAPRILVPQ